MRAYRILFFHELRTALLSPSTWIAWFLFLAIMGFFYQGIVQEYTDDGGQESLPSIRFFRLFWFPVVFMIPLLTMKSIAEERRLGTLSNMFSTAISSSAYIGAKFTSCYVLYMMIWLSTLAFPEVVSIIWHSPLGISEMFARNEDSAALWDAPALVGSFLFVALSGLLFVSIGIFTSAITRSQLVAGVLSFSLLFVVLIGGKIITEYPFWGPTLSGSLVGVAEYLQTFRHLEDFSRGVIDTRPFLFYTSFSLLFLTISGIVVKAKS